LSKKKVLKNWVEFGATHKKKINRPLMLWLVQKHFDYFCYHMDFASNPPALLAEWNSGLKNANNCLNTNIFSYLETSGGKNYNLYLNVVHFFNTCVN
jgi:hypothetical protein